MTDTETKSRVKFLIDDFEDEDQTSNSPSSTGIDDNEDNISREPGQSKDSERDDAFYDVQTKLNDLELNPPIRRDDYSTFEAIRSEQSLTNLNEKNKAIRPHSSYVTLSRLANALSTSSDALTLIGDPDNPYSRKLREPQNVSVSSIQPQFIFRKPDNSLYKQSAKSLRHCSSSRSLISMKPLSTAHPSSNTSESKKANPDSSAAASKHSISKAIKGSSLDLMRFFKNYSNHGSPSYTSSHSRKSTFQDHENLAEKYGEFGPVLGSGAGGSVRIIKRSSDGKVFAVKQFRPRVHYETAKEYSKKVVAEFCIGSTLHHPNIIETLDIVQEGRLYFEVMEYARYDVFATVMNGHMKYEEIICFFKQIMNGVAYLHTMGLAHRDMKLDNLMINSTGIVKIIDFGSAIVFKYPFEKDKVLATGVCGSDPYLAPEVLKRAPYDPSLADVWSCALIFCCMYLRRFPWKVPKMSDPSFSLFAQSDQPESSKSNVNSSADNINNLKNPSTPSNKEEQQNLSPSAQKKAADNQIKGAWRLLRLLPEESRHTIGTMLSIDVKSRSTIMEALLSDWMQGTQMCIVNFEGSTCNADNHKHTLVDIDNNKYVVP